MFSSTVLMMIRTSNSREKVLAWVAAVTVLCSVVFSVIIEPQLECRHRRLERLYQLRVELARTKRDLVEKDRIDRVYTEIGPLISTGGSDQQEISKLTRQLSDLYSKLNVKIRSVKILPVVGEEFWRRLSVRIEMAGDIRSILRFVISIETACESVRIEQLDLKSQEIADKVRASFLITKVVAGSQRQVD